MRTEQAKPATNDLLIDRFGRRVDYIRISVTDRCDFRCVYCMSEQMTFLPRNDVLSLEEIVSAARAFVEMGVRKIRLTGGEPLVRRGVIELMATLSALPGLDELVMTTNGSQLNTMAKDIRAAGVKRLNISLDSLQPERFANLTRKGRLDQVLEGIDAAQAAGFKRTKLNAVIMRGRNDDEVLDLVEFARDKQLDISFIEEMPLGQISEHNRGETYCSSDDVQRIIESRYALTPMDARTAGPSKYFSMHDSDSRIGFISPHSHNFCHECNRVRLTVEGRLLLCLGNEHSMDLREYMRKHPGDSAGLKAQIRSAMDLKPEQHHFDPDGAPQILRFMNMTGG